ncbi:MAG TPA: hypothetical protein VD926_12830 [Acidimicrobiales bacterium]|nr:hypothetical protein [Acidimicrobiales bacterium]
MIAGVLVLGLIVGREVVRAHDPDGPAVRIVGRLLLPASIGLGALVVLRLLDLVVGGA